MVWECYLFTNHVLTLLCSGLGRHVFILAMAHCYNVVRACMCPYRVVVNHTSSQACHVPRQTRACVGSPICIPTVSQLPSCGALVMPVHTCNVPELHWVSCACLFTHMIYPRAPTHGDMGRFVYMSAKSQCHHVSTQHTCSYAPWLPPGSVGSPVCTTPCSG